MSLPMPMPPLPPIESGVKIFRFYDNVTEPPHTGENMRWKCRLCDSRISSSRRATSNLITHIQRKHPCEYATYQREKESTRVLSGGGGPGGPGGPGGGGGGARSLNTTLTAITKYLSTLKYADNDFQQVKLNDALIYMVADNLLPFSFVESGGFHQLMSVADVKYVPPSAKHLATALFPTKRRQVEDALRELLCAPNQVCVTLDAWSSSSSSSSSSRAGAGHGCNASFLVMAAHFVRQDWTCKSVLLACHVHDGQLTCTGENVVQQYEEVAELFQIRSKVRHVVTDSVLYETRVAEVLLLGNAVKRESMVGDDVTYGRSTMTATTTTTTTTHPIQIQETDLLKQLPERMNCFACSLQSVVKYGFHVCRPIVGILAKVCTLMNHLRNSAVTSELVQSGLLAAASSSAMGSSSASTVTTIGRWHSQLKLARTFLRIPESVLLNAASSTCLSAEEHAVLTEFLEIMEPFEEAVEQIQGGEQAVSASNVIPCVRGLKLTLKSMRLNYCCELVERLSECIEAELGAYESCDTFVLSTVVDPRFKMDWCSPDEIVSLQAMLFEEMRNAVNTDASLLESGTVAAEPPEDLSNSVGGGGGVGAAPPASKRPKLFCYMSGSFTTSFRDPYRDTEERIAQEITHYLASKCVPHSFDPLGWWRCHVLEFPILASIARNILCVCASAYAAEQVLDRRLLEAARHPDITNEQFESMVFLRSNAFA